MKPRSEAAQAALRRLSPKAAPQSAPSQKLFYKIGEVSRITQLEAYVLRYWETEFSVLRPRKTAGGQRLYTQGDVELVLDIKRMLYEQKYTISGAKKQLHAKARRDREPVPSKALIGSIKGQLQSILNELNACEPPVPSIRGEAQGRTRSDSIGA